jgi:plasmid stabilization system protein ParE
VSRRVSFRPEAEAEALETRDWYEGRRLGLGAEFRVALDETIERIADSPMQFRLVRGETRRAILNRFPYAVYFRLDGNDIVVLAVHGRQHPRRWQSRRSRTT